MTRENKLALVVGFGLILFVGILISDHFSTVRNQQAADLTTKSVAMDDPLSSQRQSNAGLIELRPIASEPRPAVATDMIDTNRPSGEMPQPEQRASIYPGGLPGPTPIAQDTGATQLATGGEPAPQGFEHVKPEPEPIQVSAQAHEVKSGETFYAICRQHYGNASLVNSLAKFNNLDDPSELKVGMRLQIPPAELIGGRPSAPRSVTPTAPAPARNAQPGSENGSAPTTKPLPMKFVQENRQIALAPVKPVNASTYTVRPGDNLANIAARVYGSRAKWKKLYDLNRHVINDPDEVRPGTVLKVL